MSHCNEFDYVVVNDEFERAIGELEMIIAAWEMRCYVADPSYKR